MPNPMTPDARWSALTRPRPSCWPRRGHLCRPGPGIPLRQDYEYQREGVRNVHGDEQRQLRSPDLQPGMVAAVDLHQHALLWHAPAPEPVLLGAAAARTADACLDQNSAQRGTAQVDALAFPQQFGEMSMVGARIAVAGQLHHGSRSGCGNGIVGPTPPVPVGQCGSTVLAVSREEPLGMTFTHSHNLGCLGDGKLVFQNAVENLNPCLFLLIQRYIPHRDDIFADQLAGDRIVDHQHR